MRRRALGSRLGQVGNSSTCATGYIPCVDKTGWKLFYQFRSQGFLKWRMIAQVESNRLQLMNGFWVDINWSSINRYQSIPIDWYRLVFRSSISIDWIRPVAGIIQLSFFALFRTAKQRRRLRCETVANTTNNNVNTVILFVFRGNVICLSKSVAIFYNWIIYTEFGVTRGRKVGAVPSCSIPIKRLRSWFCCCRCYVSYMHLVWPYFHFFR